MKQETLEEVAKIICHTHKTPLEQANEIVKLLEERSYSEEDIKLAFEEGFNVCRCVTDNANEAKECFNEWFNRFKNK